MNGLVKFWMLQYVGYLVMFEDQESMSGGLLPSQLAIHEIHWTMLQLRFCQLQQIFARVDDGINSSGPCDSVKHHWWSPNDTVSCACSVLHNHPSTSPRRVKSCFGRVKKNCHYIGIVCVACRKLLKMGIRTGAMKSLGRALACKADYSHQPGWRASYSARLREMGFGCYTSGSFASCMFYINKCTDLFKCNHCQSC